MLFQRPFLPAPQFRIEGDSVELPVLQENWQAFNAPAQACYSSDCGRQTTSMGGSSPDVRLETPA